jgi:hypothetical protein
VRQLFIEDCIGSLEVGKDDDIAGKVVHKASVTPITIAAR